METIQEIVKRAQRSYNRAGEHYDRETEVFNNEIAYPHLIAMLEGAIGSVREKRVLDVGCGSGRLMTKLAARGAYVSGIDIAPTYVAKARGRGHDVRKASMLKLPFPDGSFDAVVSYFCLDYVPRVQKRRALSEQNRVLRSGGVTVFACWYATPETPGRLALPILDEEFILYPEHKQTIVKMIVESGFRECRITAARCTSQEVSTVVSTIGNPAIRTFIERFEQTPYAHMVLAEKI